MDNKYQLTVSYPEAIYIMNHGIEIKIKGSDVVFYIPPRSVIEYFVKNRQNSILLSSNNSL